MEQFIFADADLARRLEGAEGRSNAEFVEARARLFPESGARWIEVAGAYAMFDGPQSPITQTFGLGLFDAVTAAELERLEDFYRGLDAPVFHEVSPMGDASLAGLLGGRGYHPVEFTSVMFRPPRKGAGVAAPRGEKLVVRVVGEDEHELWARTSARGWSEFPEVAGMMYELALVSAKRPGTVSFLAELDGRPVATGGLGIHEGVALLAGASTVPEERRQGAQSALLEARLRHAAERGCDLALMGALPGSASQRNAERQGFRIAYTRAKWGRAGVSGNERSSM
jgi:GNAT superfamily N-acetyltransferase